MKQVGEIMRPMTLWIIQAINRRAQELMWRAIYESLELSPRGTAEELNRQSRSTLGSIED